MTLSLKSVAVAGMDVAHATMTRSFEDYIGGAFQIDLPGFQEWFSLDGSSPNLSQIVYRDGDPVGLALIARRGWTVRLSAMGIVAEARFQGIGKWMMTQMIAQARQRGDRVFELESYEQNAPAVALYSGFGFQVFGRAYAYSLADPAPGEPADLEEVDILAVARLLFWHGLPDLPWQSSGTAMARLGPPHRAFHLDHAYAIVTPPEQNVIIIRSLVTLPECQNQGRAQRLIRALFAAHPGKTWRVLTLCPERVGRGVFEKLGFVRAELNQVLMRLRLDQRYGDWASAPG